MWNKTTGVRTYRIKDVRDTQVPAFYLTDSYSVDANGSVLVNSTDISDMEIEDQLLQLNDRSNWLDAYYEVERVIGAYITIGANTANDVNGNTVEAIINGENIALVTLYFDVTDYVAGTPGVEAIVTDKFAAFAFEDVMVLNKEAKEVNEAYKTVTTITVEKFLDINADAHVNYADVLAMWKMISGEAEVEYNVVADVDKNGIVEAKDFMDLYSFVLGELDYEDMVAIVAEEEVAA